MRPHTLPPAFRRFGLRDWHMCRWTFSVLAALCLTSTIIVSNGTAKAEVFTCGTRSNYFDGKSDERGTVSSLGAAATISGQYGAVCDTDTSQGNFTASWAMIQPQAASGWVQSGRVRWYNHCTVVFAQSYDGKNDNPRTFYGTTCQADSGGTNTFTELYSAGCTCIQAEENGNALQNSYFNPNNAWPTPWGPEFMGEAGYTQSDMPGNSASPTKFSNLQRQTSNGFVDYACSVLSIINDGSRTRADGEKWFNDTPTCPGFQIYTDTAG